MLHITLNGVTMTNGMDGMRETALAKSVCNKFEWMTDSFMEDLKYGDRERRIDIIRYELSLRNYLIIFRNVEKERIRAWIYGQDRLRVWFRVDDDDNYSGSVCYFINESVDISQ